MHQLLLTAVVAAALATVAAFLVSTAKAVRRDRATIRRATAEARARRDEACVLLEAELVVLAAYNRHVTQVARALRDLDEHADGAAGIDPTAGIDVAALARRAGVEPDAAAAAVGIFRDPVTAAWWYRLVTPQDPPGVP
jgi:hypothetical protein